MEKTTRHLDVPLYEGGEPSHDVVPRSPGETWVVPTQPITVGEPIVWTHYTKETQVMIPLLPYLVNPDPVQAMAFMARLGVYMGVAVGRPIKRIHVSIGHPIQQVNEPSLGGNLWQVQIGFGLVFK